MWKLAYPDDGNDRLPKCSAFCSEKDDCGKSQHCEKELGVCVESKCKDHVKHGNVAVKNQGSVGDKGELTCKPGFKPRIAKSPVLEKRNTIEVNCAVNRFGNTVWVDNLEDINQVFCERGACQIGHEAMFHSLLSIIYTPGCHSDHECPFGFGCKDEKCIWLSCPTLTVPNSNLKEGSSSGKVGQRLKVICDKGHINGLKLPHIDLTCSVHNKVPKWFPELGDDLQCKEGKVTGSSKFSTSVLTAKS